MALAPEYGRHSRVSLVTVGSSKRCLYQVTLQRLGKLVVDHATIGKRLVTHYPCGREPAPTVRSHFKWRKLWIADPNTTAPAAIATQNPLRAPNASTSHPELAAPIATPMLNPVTSDVRPSVSLAGGTMRSTNAIATISVGAKNSPATNTASASPNMFVASSNGNVVTAVATPP